MKGYLPFVTVQNRFFNPLTARVKPWVIQSSLTFEAFGVTIHWKAVDQYFTVVLFVFQFYPVCNFGKFMNFELGTVRSDWSRQANLTVQLLKVSIFIRLALQFEYKQVWIISSSNRIAF